MPLPDNFLLSASTSTSMPGPFVPKLPCISSSFKKAINPQLGNCTRLRSNTPVQGSLFTLTYRQSYPILSPPYGGQSSYSFSRPPFYSGLNPNLPFQPPTFKGNQPSFGQLLSIDNVFAGNFSQSFSSNLFAGSYPSVFKKPAAKPGSSGSSPFFGRGGLSSRAHGFYGGRGSHGSCSFFGQGIHQLSQLQAQQENSPINSRGGYSGRGGYGGGGNSGGSGRIMGFNGAIDDNIIYSMLEIGLSNLKEGTSKLENKDVCGPLQQASKDISRYKAYYM